MTCLRNGRSTICGSRPSGDEPGDRIREGDPRGDERHGADRLHDDDRTGWPAGAGCPCGGAERAGFDFSVTSDHYFPWLESQGHVSYEWSVLGAAAQATERIPLMTYVTSPTTRYHPVDVAQKAATMQLLSQGRLRLGLGSGENLNEHVVGGGWPAAHIRLEVPEEAVEIIRSLFAGENLNHHGARFDVENARLWDLPDAPPPIGVAVSGDRSCELAGHAADLMIATEPRPELISAFDRYGGTGKPRAGPAIHLLRHRPRRGDRPRRRSVPLVRRRLAGQLRAARTRRVRGCHRVRTARGRGRVHSLWWRRGRRRRSRAPRRRRRIH